MKSLVIATIFTSYDFAASAMSGNGEICGLDKTPGGASKNRTEVVAELREAQAASTHVYGNFGIKRNGAIQRAPSSRLTRSELLMESAQLAAESKLFLNNNSHGGIHRN